MHRTGLRLFAVILSLVWIGWSCSRTPHATPALSPSIQAQASKSAAPAALSLHEQAIPSRQPESALTELPSTTPQGVWVELSRQATSADSHVADRIELLRRPQSRLGPNSEGVAESSAEHRIEITSGLVNGARFLIPAETECSILALLYRKGVAALLVQWEAVPVGTRVELPIDGFVPGTAAVQVRLGGSGLGEPERWSVECWRMDAPSEAQFRVPAGAQLHWPRLGPFHPTKDGTCVVQALSQGRWKFSARGPLGEQSSVAELELAGEQQSSVDLVYNGKPSARALVLRLRGTRDTVSGLSAMRIDLVGADRQPTGIYGILRGRELRFDDLPDGEYRAVTSDARVLPAMSAVAKPGQFVDLELRGSASLRIRVVDAETSQPIPSCEWWLFEGRPGAMNSPHLRAGQQASALGESLIDGLIPREYCIQVAAPGFATGRFAVGKNIAPDSSPLVCKLERAGSLKVLFQPQTSAGETPAKARICRVRSDTSTQSVEIYIERTLKLGNTGECLWENLAPGLYVVEILEAERVLAQRSEVRVLGSKQTTLALP